MFGLLTKSQNLATMSFTDDWDATAWEKRTQLDTDAMLNYILVDLILGNRATVPWSSDTRFYYNQDFMFVGWTITLNVNDEFVVESDFIPAHMEPTGERARKMVTRFARNAQRTLRTYGYNVSPRTEYDN